MKTIALSAAVLAILLTTISPAVAKGKALPGFVHTDKTLNELLAEGYDLKNGSVGMMGVMFTLQKGTTAAVCGVGPNENMECMLSLDPATARSEADKKRVE